MTDVKTDVLNATMIVVPLNVADVFAFPVRIRESLFTDGYRKIGIVEPMLPLTNL